MSVNGLKSQLDLIDMGFAQGLSYTDFAYRFVEFITHEKLKAISNQ